MKFTLKKSKKSGTKLMNNMINFKNLLKILEYNTEKTILKEKLTKIHLEIQLKLKTKKKKLYMMYLMKLKKNMMLQKVHQKKLQTKLQLINKK